MGDRSGQGSPAARAFTGTHIAHAGTEADAYATDGPVPQPVAVTFPISVHLVFADAFTGRIGVLTMNIAVTIVHIELLVITGITLCVMVWQLLPGSVLRRKRRP